VRHGRERWPEAALWLAGFSFGGAVAIRAAAVASPAGLVTVAPAIGRVDVADVAAPECPWLLVQGDADDLVSPAEVVAWTHRLPRPPQLAMLPGVGHLFHGRLNELRDVVTGFLKTQKPG
jgi:alpha/beta superfamily hydrolase